MKGHPRSSQSEQTSVDSGLRRMLCMHARHVAIVYVANYCCLVRTERLMPGQKENGPREHAANESFNLK